MKCPHCAHSELEPVLTTQGIEVDRCGSCGGVWLDRGAIFHFAKRPKRVAERARRGARVANAERNTLAGRGPADGRDRLSR